MKFTLSNEHMSESYDQVRRYGSKALLVERLAGAAFLVLGIGLAISAQGTTVTPYALAAIGVLELLSNRIKKYFWLRRHARSKLLNAEIELDIDEAGLKGTGPFSSGHFSWRGIEKVVRTPKGILVWPQKGMYIYVPEHAAGQRVIDLIHAKATEAARASG